MFISLSLIWRYVDVKDKGIASTCGENHVNCFDVIFHLISLDVMVLIEVTGIEA